MSHAVVSMVDKLRQEGTNGFLFANGGFATDNHCIVLSKQPVAAATFPQDFNYQTEADAAREAVPELIKDYLGDGSVETYTVFYGRDGSPKGGVVVARTPSGDRTLAQVDVTDAQMIAFLTDGKIEPVGTSGQIVQNGAGQRVWAKV